MSDQEEEEGSEARGRVLWWSTIAFTLAFNVWMMLGVLGIPIRSQLGLSDAQLEWLIATAILSGSVLRLNFGIWADVYGGRRVMSLMLLGAALPTYLFSQAATYAQLLNSQSDNNVKLIVLERLDKLKKRHAKVLQVRTMLRG